MENEIIERNQYEVSIQRINTLLKSGLLPGHIKTAEQAYAIAEMGKAVGLKTVIALNTIYVVGGKPTITPAMMLALARQRGMIADQKIERLPDRVIFTVLRKGDLTAHIEVYGKIQADQAGLSTKDNYKKQPQTMWLWRAVAAAMRAVFPDVIYGLYTPEEMGAVVEVNADDELEGIVIESNKPFDPMLGLNKIRDRLAIHFAGDEEKMNAQLMLMTEHKEGAEVKFIQLSDLEQLAKEKPRWIEGILMRMDKSGIGLNHE